MRTLSQLCFVAGLISIPLSICMWAWGPEMSATTFDDSNPSAHKERWGIFVGLWAPTFLILSHILHARDLACRETIATRLR